MDLQEAFFRQKIDLRAAKREAALLRKQLEQQTERTRKGIAATETFRKQLSHIQGLNKKVSEMTRIADRYKLLYEQERERYKKLYESSLDLECRYNELQWQMDCLNGTSSDRGRTAKEEADAKIKALSDEVARLTALLEKDGTNAGIPTSKTPPGKKKVIPNTREKTGMPKGGQPGHLKHSMAPFPEEEVTEVIPHELDACPYCGGTLHETREIPKDELDYEVKVVKKRHLFKEYICDNCGRTIRTKDSSLKAENQYGPGMQASALALMNLGFVSINRTKSLLCGIDSYSISISEGYLVKLQKRCSGKLRSFVEEVRAACIGSPLLYWDDTVVFINTSRACMRFYGNEKLAFYTAHMKKDLEGLMEDRILPALPSSATVMHDHNTINYHKGFSFRNVECLQHLERDLQELIEISHHKWAEELKELIKHTIHKRKQLIAASIIQFTEEEISSFMARYDSLLESGYKEYFKSIHSYFSSKENALLNRLRTYRLNYTEWVRDFSIPTTNNLSERSLRFVKCKDKISGQFLSEAYAKYFADIRTYIETCVRNGVNAFQAFLRLTRNNPYTLQELCTASDD